MSVARYTSAPSYSSAVLSAALVLAFVARIHAQTTSLWIGPGGGNWSDPNSWQNVPSIEAFPDNGAGGNFDVVLDRALVNLDRNITIDNLTLGSNAAEGGRVIGSNQLTANGDVLVGRLGGFRQGTGTFTALGPVRVSGAWEVDGWTVRAMQSVQVGVGDGDGEVRLANGGQLILSNGLALLKDADITLSGSNSTKIVNNGGTFAKTGGNAASDVAVRFEDNQGTIGASAGILRFNLQPVNLTQSTLEVDGGEIQFNGPTAISGPLTYRGENSGMVTFDGPAAAVTLAGQFTTDGSDSSDSFVVFSGASFSGGVLDLAPGNDFIHQSGTLGGAQQVTNQGAFRWHRGMVTGAGLVNENRTVGETLIEENTPKSITAGALTNHGHLTQTGQVNLGAGGMLINETAPGSPPNAEAVYLLAGSTITANGGDAMTKFINQGTLAASGSSVISAPLDSTGVVSAQPGKLTIRGETSLSGKLRVDHAAGASTLELAPIPGNRVVLNGAEIDFLGGANQHAGTLAFASGMNELTGEIKSTGVGRAEFLGGTLRVPAGAAATVNMLDSAPLILNANPNLAGVQLDGDLSNVGLVQWQSGTVAGDGRWINAADEQRQLDGLIQVTGTATLSDGTKGTLENHAFVEIRSPANQGLILKNQGRVTNFQDGAFDILGDGGLFVANDASPSRTRFQNNGIFSKLDGTSSAVDVPFEQSASGSIEVVAGQLAFFGGADLEGAVALTQTSGKTAPSLLLGSNSHLDDLTLSLNGGDVQLAGSVNTVSGSISGTGSGGRLRLLGDLLTISDTTFNVRGDSVGVIQEQYRLEGQHKVVNEGNYELTTAASIRVDFENVGAFIASGGRIEAPFQNGSADTSPDATFTVLPAAGAAAPTTLFDAALTNDGEVVLKDAALEFDRSATLANNKTIRLEGASRLAQGPSPTIHQRFMNEDELLVVNGPDEMAVIEVRTSIDRGRLRVVDEQAPPTGDPETSGLQVTGGYFLRTAVVTVVGPKSAQFNDSSAVSSNSNGVFDVAHEFVETPGAPAGEVHYHDATLVNFLLGEGRGTVYAEDAELKGAKFLFSDGAEVHLRGNLFADRSNFNSGRLRISSIGDNAFRSLEGITPLINETGGTLLLDGAQLKTVVPRQGLVQTVRNNGTVELLAGQRGGNSLENMVLDNRQGGVMNVRSGNLVSAGDSRIVNGGQFFGHADADVNVAFDNQQLVEVNAGHLLLGPVEQLSGGVLLGGTWTVNDGATLTLRPKVGNAEIDINGGNVTLRGSGALTNFPNSQANIDFINGGRLSLEQTADVDFGNGHFQNIGALNIDAGSKLTVGSFDNDDAATINGQVVVRSGAITGGGRISGSGVISSAAAGALQVANLGIIGPGNSPGRLTIDGDITDRGVMEIELAGAQPGDDFDVLDVVGSADLGGIVAVRHLNGFSPTLGSTFDVVTAASVVDSEYSLAQLNGPLVAGAVANTGGGQALRLATIAGKTYEATSGSWENTANWPGGTPPMATDTAHVAGAASMSTTLVGPLSDVEVTSLVVGSGEPSRATTTTLALESGMLTAMRGTTLRSDGVLTGEGQLVGAVYNDGMVAPGLGVGGISIAGDYVQSGSLAIEIGGPTPVQQHDLLDVAGRARFFEGSHIDLSLQGGFTLSLGDSFVVVAADALRDDGLVIGRPENLPVALAVGGEIIDLPGQRQGLEVDVVLAGDFNDDDIVDGRDFLAWQRGTSPDPISSTDLAGWQANFGASTAIVSSAVPEPGSCLLILIGSYLLGASLAKAER